jgi:hypothetical protein
MKKYWVIGGILFFAIAGVLGYSLINKPHRSVADEIGIEVSSSDLFLQFETNEEAGNTKFLDKAILVSGEVAEIVTNQEGKTVVILATDNPLFGVSCTMEGSSDGVQIGSSVTIKGICVGYLSDVVINRAIITKINE